MNLCMYNVRPLQDEGFSHKAPTAPVLRCPSPLFAPEFSYFVLNGLPLLLVPSLGSHSVTLVVSLLRIACPARARFFEF